ncbi:anthranilate synthase component II [Psychromonas antarctica]|jgi:anthranilate synthase/aminodeoxychorismate synthase-like glutamine amidotransferase|uniref:anthranilate synthase component II n=1 Tax=Psychromonas antarctica TaxID=67573 RepID=UPI001EE86C6E|nr:aminodeoxychorismate/anthranilate synthase component II [Psychromonas antarctica]MCG6200733.1 aminodeoxychorismate/anthranilate synthase component II [Psychromonas antarctica]
MLLMIDNYDSFTYNLVQYFGELKQQVIVKRNDQISLQEIADLNPDYLVISPGPCTPNDAGISLAAIERFAGQIPLLGVCLGHQSIAQVFGAQVVRADKVMHGKNSLIEHDGKGVFSGLRNPLDITRYHSLVVDPDSLPDCFNVSATVINSNEIMAIRHNTLMLEGVQFHPESIMSEQGLKLLNNFLVQGIGFKK